MPNAEFRPAGQGIALDRSDQRLDRRPLGEPQPAPLHHDVLATGERLEIHTRAEGPAGTGQHTHRQGRVVVELVHRGGQSVARRGVDGVLGLRTVDRDDQDPPTLLGQDHITLRWFLVLTHGGIVTTGGMMTGRSDADCASLRRAMAMVE
jgi:hypothetical protein